ncbi:two-component sensor histidine kinase [Finegoldia magna]|uniref:sensor histidine kinase n=1 Tax=Finegoldia magna TaxID=1260 RepID=UPI000B91C655|nr:HAMP domain-containing sensor histidine kinase [Finegoldia magna]OXZ30877.1 two-component sensor histidine kinase [Finegoldia magna]
MSIKNKIMYSFVFLTSITAIILVIFSIYATKFYYYSTMEGVLNNEIRYSTNLYSSYMADYELDEVIAEDKNQFYRQTDCQVQILDNNQIVVFDSIASPNLGKKIETSDVVNAVNGQNGSYTGKVSYSDSNIISVSVPLESRGKQVGVLRYISSLKDVDRAIRVKSVSFALFGFLVILFSILLSKILTKSIVKPINSLAKTAEKMAKGNMEVRAKENNTDEIGRLGMTLNLLTDNINKKEQLKNEFISSVSHELRTPLTSIKGWAQTLKYDLSDLETTTMGIDIIDSECDRLTTMVEELLDFSRFTSGRISIVKRKQNLIELAEHIKNQLLPKVRSKGIDLILNYESPELIATFDEDRIKQVFINILDNAVKFTPEKGTIIINIEKIEKFAKVSIIDTGIGISFEEIELVTGKFYKGSNSNSHVGLGLSICEEIVKLHKGELMIKSKIDEGTTVSFTLPLGDDENEKNN